MQQPPYPPNQQPPPGYPPARPKPKQPFIIWVALAVLIGGILYCVGAAFYVLAFPKPQPRAYIVHHFDKENQSSEASSKTFEAQGFLHIYYDCDYEVNFDGTDVTFSITNADTGTVVWQKSVDCPVVDGAGISVTSGSYIASVSVEGDVNWSFSVYQTL